MIDLRHDQVAIADASIHTVTAGPPDAPALVLLHGWPESWVTWRELIPLAAPGHRIVAIDLPGIGGSGRGSTPGFEGRYRAPRARPHRLPRPPRRDPRRA